MKIILLLSVMILASCGKQSTVQVYPIKTEALSRFVNEKSLPADPNLTIDKSIVNDKYPIHIALYKDGNFYYDLPTLGDGHGTWVHKGDHLELKAKRTLFDMYIEVHGTQEGAETLTIEFTDRFGPKLLQMVNKNL